MDKTLLVLCAGLGVSIGSSFLAAIFFPANSELLTALLTLTANFSGAIFRHVTG